MSQVGSAPAERRLFTSDFAFATLANFFNGFGQQMLTATLPVYVIAIGGTQSDVGLVSGALAFTALLLRPLIGWITDHWRRRPLILVGTFSYGLANVVYLLSGSVGTLLIGRVVHGFGLSNYTTASNAYLADIAPASRRGEALGLFSVAMTFGWVVGPAVGFAVVAQSGFQSLFLVAAVFGFASFLVSLVPRERRPDQAKRPARWSLRTGLVAIDALPVAWTALCLGLGFGPLIAFIPIFAQSRGIENPGFYFTVQALFLLGSRAFAGRLADTRGRAFVMVPGIISVALSLAVLPFAEGFPAFVASAALFGLGFGAAQPAAMAMLVDRVRSEQRGLAMSTYFLGFDLGIAVGSVGLGAVGQTWGIESIWPIAAGCTLLGLLGIVGDRRFPVPTRR